MNYDPTFYMTLHPLAVSLQPYAGTLFAASAAWLFLRAGIRATDGKAGKPLRKLLIAAGLSFGIFIAFYVPVAQPGRWLGFSDMDVNLQEMPADKVPVAVWVAERLSTGVDSLIVIMLGHDATISATRDEFQNNYKAPLDPEDRLQARSISPPNDAQLVMTLIVQRSRFLLHYAQLLWSPASKPPEPEGESTKDEESLLSRGWNFVKGALSFDTEQLGTFIEQRIASLIYSLGAFVLWLVAVLLIAIIGLFLLLVAGVAKYMLVWVLGIAMVLLPVAYFFRGLGALKTLGKLTLAYVFWKPAVIVVIYLTFFLVEATILQGLRDVNFHDSTTLEVVDSLGPGELFTPVGFGIYASVNASESFVFGIGELSLTLLYILVLLLGMVFAVFKVPSIVSSLFGTRIFGGNFVSMATMTATTLGTSTVLGMGSSANNAGDRPAPGAPPQKVD